MATVVISPQDIGARLRQDGIEIPKMLKQAMFSAAQLGKSLLVKDSPVDRGILRNAWRVMMTETGSDLINDQPYAGVMEMGARPFFISKAGLESLAKWVMRKFSKFLIQSQKTQERKDAVKAASKLLQQEIRQKNKFGRGKKRIFGPKQNTKLSHLRKRVKAKMMEEQAMQIAIAISRQFQHHGIRGRRFVWKNLRRLMLIMDKEIKRFMDSFFNRTRSK